MGVPEGETVTGLRAGSIVSAKTNHRDMDPIQRRRFIRSMATAATATAFFSPAQANATAAAIQDNGNRFRISLNAYSFNKPLTAGTTDLFRILEFCAGEGFDAADLTAYYFPGYPAIPPDDYLYRLKRKAHSLGLAISGTGIRNEFAGPDAAERNAEIAFVKKWIEAAARLGAPVLRIFTGKTLPQGYARKEVEQWITDAVGICADHAQHHGVILAMQNHNDFVKTADEAISILEKVNSEWFGLVLDTGSFVTHEPYAEISKAARFAVNWQVKERFTYNGQTQDMDLSRLFRIVRSSPYRGYLPIETLSPGDPFAIVPPFFRKVKAALAKIMKEP
jgi:sugar phosphate isomerase/epimerase